MEASSVSLDLMEFVEQNILPKYAGFDKAHRLPHVTRVIKASLDIAKRLGADPNMAYAIAAYHDLGLEGPRAIHHLTSGKIVLADRRLRRWFTEEQIKIMKEAVEDHRASSSHTPRSIYGKIVAEADRELDSDIVFARIVEYGIDHYPEKSKEEQWQRFVDHCENKYSNHGYIKLWIPNSPNEQKIKIIRAIIADKAKLRQAFDNAFEQHSETL